MARGQVVCSIDFWGSRGQCKTACPPIRFQIPFESVFKIPDFYMLEQLDFDRKSGRNWVKIKPFGMKRRSVNAQRRGESIGPPFSGLKISRNGEK